VKGKGKSSGQKGRRFRCWKKKAASLGLLGNLHTGEDLGTAALGQKERKEINDSPTAVERESEGKRM